MHKTDTRNGSGAQIRGATSLNYCTINSCLAGHSGCGGEPPVSDGGESVAPLLGRSQILNVS